MVVDGQIGLDAAELRRLEECVKEPIRTPGRIQSFGKLFVVDVPTYEIVTVSENAGRWLGRSVSELQSPTLEWSVTAETHGDPIRVEIDDEAYDAVTHRQGDRVIIELEPTDNTPDLPSASVVGAIRSLGLFTGADELRQAAAEEVKRISGFDRVMVYRFFDDGHGEVAGEASEPGMESYRGLHFPASDIPQQARSLYLTKLSRQIVSTEDAGTPLVSGVWRRRRSRPKPSSRGIMTSVSTRSGRCASTALNAASPSVTASTSWCGARRRAR